MRKTQRTTPTEFTQTNLANQSYLTNKITKSTQPNQTANQDFEFLIELNTQESKRTLLLSLFCLRQCFFFFLQNVSLLNKNSARMVMGQTCWHEGQRVSAKLTQTVALQPSLRISIVDILESRDLECFHSIEKSRVANP